MQPEDKIIYLDNAATTYPSKEIADTYFKLTNEYFANSSSIHFLGAKSLHLLEVAKKQILNCLKMFDHEVIFTCSATESINLAIKGYCLKNSGRGKHIITSNIEHPAVSESIKFLVKYHDFEVTYLPVDEKGHISLDEFKASIKSDTILVSLMAVNNEIGSILPIKEIAEILKEYPKIAFHCDATQAIGKIDIDYQGVDLLSFSGHKFHCLKSTGALIKRKKVSLLPILDGGGQENGVRSGTVDVPLMACLAKSIRLEMENLKTNFQYIETLKKTLINYLLIHKDTYLLNSHDDNPYIVNFTLLNKKASVVVEALSKKGIMVSSASACNSKKEKESSVIYALYHDLNMAKNSIRVSFSYFNKKEDVLFLIKSLDEIIGGIK